MPVHAPSFEINIPVYCVSLDSANYNLMIGDKKPDIYIACGHIPALSYKSVPGAKPFWFLQHDDDAVVSFAYPDLYDSFSREFSQALETPTSKLCNSHWLQAELSEKYGVESVFIPMGIEHSLFHPSSPMFPKSSHPVIVSILNHGQNWKGSNDLFLAVRQVMSELPDTRLILISAVEPHGLVTSPQVEVVINPRQQDLKHIYASADVFVSASWLEGFGLPGLEAMACGVPVVTTDSGGVREYAWPDQTAVVAAPQNPGALANGILRVLRDTPLQKRLIRNGLKTAEQFRWDNAIDVLESVLESA